MKKRLVLLGLLLSVTCAARAAGPWELATDIPAAGLQRVVLNVGVGEVRVSPSGDDAVHVHVTLRPKQREFLWFFHWRSSGTAREIAGATLNQRVQGGTLRLSLHYPTDHSDDVRQLWTVQLPARMALATHMKVGQLIVNGVSGGVSAKLNVGQVALDVPRGALNVDVNVGEIRARSHSAEHGDIALSSTIGQAQLYIAGKRIGTGEAHGLGVVVDETGTGPGPMRLKVNIGEVSLHITPQDSGVSAGRR